MAQKPAVFGLQSHGPAVQIATSTTDPSVQETSALKRTRDGEDDMVKDTETLEQREAARVLPPQRTGGNSAVRRAGPGARNTGSGAARIGGYWKAVKRVEKPVNKKAELAQQDFEEASFLKMEIDG